MRYFHISYIMTVGASSQAANMAAHLWFHSETHPSFEDIVANIKHMNSRLNITSVVITNFHEFKSREDYEAFSGKRTNQPMISAAAAHAKMNPKKEDFKNHQEVYDKISENSDSTIGVLGYLLDEDGLWKQLQLDWMIEHFKSMSEYEKCAYIKDVKERNFYEAPPIMQGILNDQMAMSTKQGNEKI